MIKCVCASYLLRMEEVCGIYSIPLQKYVLQIFAEYILQSVEMEQHVQTDCKGYAHEIQIPFAECLPQDCKPCAIIWQIKNNYTSIILQMLYK